MRFLVAAQVVSLCLLSSVGALAASPPTDCPIGSTGKAEGENTWCEPSVCETEAQCSPGQVCRTVPLCIQVGTLDKSDAGPKLAAPAAGSTRLLAISRCGENGKCAADAVCSDKKRCVSRGEADRMTAPLPMPSAASSAAPAEGKKSSCGCSTPGAPHRGAPAAVLGGLLALGLVVRRRRSR
jgi:MYXO-CTERM domain-containing protein